MRYIRSLRRSDSELPLSPFRKTRRLFPPLGHRQRQSNSAAGTARLVRRPLGPHGRRGLCRRGRSRHHAACAPARHEEEYAVAVRHGPVHRDLCVCVTGRTTVPQRAGWDPEYACRRARMPDGTPAWPRRSYFETHRILSHRTPRAPLADGRGARQRRPRRGPHPVDAHAISGSGRFLAKSSNLALAFVLSARSPFLGVSASPSHFGPDSLSTLVRAFP